MARIRRDDAPADGDAFCFARRDGGDGRGGARLHGMLAPPRIGFGEPESVEARGVAGLRHANGFFERLHAELQDTNFERRAHRFDFFPFVFAPPSSPPFPLPSRPSIPPTLFHAAP